MADAPLHLAMRAAFAPATFNADAQTVEVVWTTGARVRRLDASGFEFWEELEVSDAAVDLSRLNAGAPLLDSHDQAGLDRLLGVVDRAWIQGREGRAVVRFSPRAAAIVADVQAGIIRNISVGYTVSEWREVPGARDRLPVRRAVRWTPHELSLVPVPADAAAQVRGAAPPSAPATSEVCMSETNEIAEAETMPAPNVAPSAAAERRRAAEIAQLAQTAKLPPEWAAYHIARGTPLARVRDDAIDHVATKGPVISSVLSPAAMLGEARTQPEAAIEYLTARLVGRAPAGEAAHYRGMRVLDVAADHANRTRGESFRVGALTPDHVRRLTTSDVPLLTETAANRALLELYPIARTGLLQVAQRMDVPDFRPMTLIRLAQHAPLDEVPQGAEVTAKYPTEAGENIALAEYSNMFPMTERVLINDDLQGIQTWLNGAAQAAATRERLLLAGLLTTGSGLGPLMSDGVRWFDAARGNIASSAALDVTSLGAAIATMRTLKDAAGQTIYGLEPGFIVVSPALELKARQLVAELSTVSDRNDVQPWAGLGVIVEPALSGNRWWVAPTLASRRCLAVGYLNGVETPRVETFTTPDTLGVTVRVTHRLAAAVSDPAGWVVNAGG